MDPQQKVEMEPNTQFDDLNVTDVTEVSHACLVVYEMISAHGGLGVTFDQLLRLTDLRETYLEQFLDVLLDRQDIRLDRVKGTYHVSRLALENIYSIFSSRQLLPISIPMVHELRDLMGESVYLGTNAGTHVDIQIRAISPHARVVEPSTTTQLPLHSSALGKVLMAHLPETELSAILNGPLEQFTPTTITDEVVMRRELAAIRRQGYAVSEEENFTSIGALAVPVFGTAGEVIAGIYVAGPVYRLSRDRSLGIVDELTKAAQRIQTAMKRPNLQQSKFSEVEPITDAPVSKSFSPVWHPEFKRYYWVDRDSKTLMSFDADTPGAKPQAIRSFETSPSALVLSHAGTLVFAGQRICNITTGKESLLDDPVKCAVAGGAEDIWLVVDRNGTDTLIHLANDDTITEHAQLEGDVQVVSYCALTGVVYLLMPDLKRLVSYKMISRRLTNLVDFSPSCGRPTAMAMDPDWNLWVCFSEGWSAQRLSLTGQIQARYALPIGEPTGLCFGGEKGQEMLMTTASLAATPQVKENAPLTGHILRIQP